MTLYYLATPYTKYKHGIEAAFVEAAKLTARLMQAGYSVYSPICHSHPVAIHGGMDPLDHSIWLPANESMMRKCDALLVATMEGWGQSDGIFYEMCWFISYEKPVECVNPSTLERTAISSATEVAAS